MSTGTTTEVSDQSVMAALLGRCAVPDRLAAVPTLWGFGGLHGGLALALLVRSIQQQSAAADPALLRLANVGATFVKPLRGDFDITVDRGHAGRATQFWTATAGAGGQAAVKADAVLSAVNAAHRPIAPAMPDAPPASDCDVFRVPVSFVPIANRTEIRPVGPARPFARGSEAQLTAWLRLVDDDQPPDVPRLVMLMDALAPSYAAILPAPVPIPTVTLMMSPAPVTSPGDSPWLLLRARTVASGGDGWLDEHLDAWRPDGTYLGHGYQRRLVLGTAPSAPSGTTRAVAA